MEGARGIFNCITKLRPILYDIPSEILFLLVAIFLVVLIRFPSQSSTKMQNSVESIFRERRPPFLFQLLLIFVCFAVFIVLSNKRYSYLSASDLHNMWSVWRTRSPAAFESPVESPSSAEAQDDVVSVKGNGNSTAAVVKWELCGVVDYVPCLDNCEAITNLTSRKHKVSLERHCPRPSVRCLVPLPAGYRVPIPWPKSRDTVRMIP